MLAASASLPFDRRTIACLLRGRGAHQLARRPRVQVDSDRDTTVRLTVPLELSDTPGLLRRTATASRSRPIDAATAAAIAPSTSGASASRACVPSTSPLSSTALTLRIALPRSARTRTPLPLSASPIAPAMTSPSRSERAVRARRRRRRCARLRPRSDRPCRPIPRPEPPSATPIQSRSRAPRHGRHSTLPNSVRQLRR